MADRNFYRKQSLQREVKQLFAKISIGATGAPTLVSGEASQGVASVARNSAGNYTLTLQDKYAALLNAQVSLLGASHQGLVPQIIAEDVDGAKTLQFEFASGAEPALAAEQEISSVAIEADDGGLATAITLANDIKAQYAAHIADASEHDSADTDNAIAAADATDLTSLITLVTELLTDFDAHESDDDADAGSYHQAQEASDATLTATAAPASLADVRVDLADLKAKYNIHDADSTAHTTGSQHQVTAADITGSLDGKYFLFSGNGTDYYAWFDIDSGSSDPSVASRTGIEIDISLGDTAATIAAAAQAAIAALTNIQAATTEDDQLLIWNEVAEDITDVGAGDSGFTVSTLADGADAVSAVTASAKDPSNGSTVMVTLELKNTKFRGA